LADATGDHARLMSVRGVARWELNLVRMFQSDLLARSTAQQRQATAATEPMAPMEIARSVGPGREERARFLILPGRNDGREPQNGIQLCLLIGNYAAHVFGTGARHVGRNCQFRPAALEGLRRDPLVQSSGPVAQAVKATAMLALVMKAIEVLGFRPAAPEGLSRGPLVRSSGPAAQAGKATAMLALVMKAIGVL
jgi:hypothetical protein